MNEEIKKLLQGILKQYIVHNNIKLEDASILNTRYKEKGFEYLEAIQNVVKKDVESASLGLNTKRMTKLQQMAFNISLNHGLMKLAEYMVTGRETINEIK
tara:strand:+ start:34 stop:333 length:300 start_codon:yes stop_codon:yes gene_type:complete